MKGNVVDWNLSKWNETNMQKIDIDSSELCKSKKIGPILLPENLPATSMLQLCQKVNGKMFVIKDAETKQTAISLRNSTAFNNKCQYSEYLFTFMSAQSLSSLMTYLIL